MILNLKISLKIKMETLYQQFIHKSRYAKYIESEQRREEWFETVSRFVKYLFEETNDKVKKYEAEIHDSILSQSVMPSMRMMMTAGECHRKENVAGYNCCYVTVDDKRVFSEIIYILMNGCGVGFSIESENVQKLPIVPFINSEKVEEYTIEDSKLGWALSIEYLFNSLYNGSIPLFNYEKIRPKGSRLKTMGGYASGHEVLKELVDFTVNIFTMAQGRKLSTLECHSIVCKIASIVVCGGVRRSALISLSDLEDKEMSVAKCGNWYENNIHFSLANNSAVYKEKPSVDKFLEEWTTIYKSHSGERGFFNRQSCQNKAKNIGRREYLNIPFGSNPCNEILLLPQEFCNLTECIIKEDDTEESLKNKIRLATIIGTLQSRYTNFNFLRPIYKENCERERLLGVSMTGIYDNPITYKPRDGFLSELKNIAINVNKEFAEMLNINQSVSITCVKPSGTVSALCASASGLHPRYAKYYIRRVRANKSDPICKFLSSYDIPHEIDFYSPENYVFSFPMSSPNDCIITKELTAVEHFKLWLKYNEEYCEHKPSVTISYSPDEYIELTNEVWKNFDNLSGISLLPRSEHNYKQAPYEEINEEEYKKLLAQFPRKVLWKRLSLYENENNTNEDELVCSGGSCDNVNIIH